MTDVFSKQKRSDIMSRVAPRGNVTTELAFMHILRRAGLRGWRRHPKLTGRPDFVFRSQRIAIFVDGCFWHGCTRCRSVPVGNRRFWEDKLRYNRQRARVVNKALRQSGWSVLRFWEHEMKSEKRVLAKLRKVIT